MSMTRWTSKTIRHVLAGAIALGCFALWVFTEVHPICRDVLAQTGTSGVVTVCAPLSTADLTTPLLVVALLLVPDFARIAIPGVVELVAKVDHVQETIDDRVVPTADATAARVSVISTRFLSSDRMTLEANAVLLALDLGTEKMKGIVPPERADDLLRQAAVLRTNPERLTDDDVERLIAQMKEVVVAPTPPPEWHNTNDR